MSFKKNLIDYAKHELHLTNFDQTSFGQNLVKLLEDLCDLTNNDPMAVKILCSWIPRLTEKLPISPITEDDFVEEAHGVGSEKVIIKRCNRYEHVYQTADGKYWDDRAVAFRSVNSEKSDIMFLYGENGSKREIVLPYYPEMSIIELSDNV